METCPICDFNATIHKMDNDGPLKILCGKCGEFILTKDALKFYNDNKQNNWQSKLSFWIRSHQGGKIEIDIRMLRNLPDRIKLPDLFEQTNNLILWIGKESDCEYNKEIELDDEKLQSIVGCLSIEGVDYILQHLKNEKIIGVESNQGLSTGWLTFKGWEKYSELNKPTSKTKIAFMAMKYNEPDLEDIFRNHIIKAVQQTGFEIDLLKDVLKAGLIDDQLRVQIRRAKFLVVDLTHGNNGAYWEAGYAEGLSKPVIYLCKKSVFDNPEMKPHFDTNHLATVTWEKGTIVEDMKNLNAIIRNTFPKEAIMKDKDEKVIN